MNRAPIIAIVLLMVLVACTKDTESPTPELPKSYFILYNYLAVPYDVTWEIEDEVLEAVHAYGTSILESRTMESEEQELRFTVKEAGGEQLIKSVIHQAKQHTYYAVALMGTESDPVVAIEVMELEKPSLGQVKLRFMHTAVELGPLDLYIGGSTPDHKTLTNFQFAQLSEYLEASQENLWESVILSP